MITNQPFRSFGQASIADHAKMNLNFLILAIKRIIPYSKHKLFDINYAYLLNYEDNHCCKVARVEAIERLDEKELLRYFFLNRTNFFPRSYDFCFRQLFHHYCITVARKNSPNFNFDSVNFD